MAIKIFGRSYRAPEEEGAEGAERESPAQVNQRGNNARLAMIERVGRTADGKRADELEDTDGQKVTGRFSGGEFDDSPEAREKAAEREEDEARAAREEQEERAAREEEEETADLRRARELQGEGAGETRGQQREETQEGDEKVVDGVRYYLTIVEGAEKWLTLKQLREHAAIVINTEETLQRAQDALQRSSSTAQTPKDEPAEISQADLETLILSASVGEEEAVRKLASVLATRPKGVDTQAISRQVAQQIATQRAVESAETEQKDFTGSPVLAPIFKQRLYAFAEKNPKTPIPEAYRKVGEEMRRDFAAMLGGERKDPLQAKADRKRTIVTPPEGVARQRTREDDGQEPSVSSDIDAIAKQRGQARAHRQAGRNR